MDFAARVIRRILHDVHFPELLGSQRGLEVPSMLGAVVHQFHDLILAESLLQLLLVIFSALPDGNRYKEAL